MRGGGFFDGCEMLMVHRAFRREFALAPALVRRVDDGDTLRCRTIAGHLQFTATTLHEHHTFEDRAVWPALWHGSPMRPHPTFVRSRGSIPGWTWPSRQ